MTFEQGNQIIQELQDLSNQIENVTTTTTTGSAISIDLNVLQAQINTMYTDLRIMIITMMTFVVIYTVYKIASIRGEK